MAAVGMIARGGVKAVVKLGLQIEQPRGQFGLSARGGGQGAKGKDHQNTHHGWPYFSKPLFLHRIGE